MTKSRLLAVAVVLVSLAGVACGSQNTAGDTTTLPPVEAKTITVSAAASLTDAFNKIGQDFSAANPGTEVRFNFDSSSTLAKQITEGAPVDVFASADTANMDKLTGAGLVAGDPQIFATNKLTIVVKTSNPENVQSLADLPGLKTVALCGTEVPCGRYADQILANAGVTIPPDKITRGQNVKTVLTAVAEGDADAGIVYVTDVTGANVDAIQIPDAQNAIAKYPIAVLKASGNQAEATAFMGYVLGADGQQVLKDAGFGPPA
jgi:molybdate transport system substrate-binding protein